MQNTLAAAAALILILVGGSGAAPCMAAGADGKFEERTSSHFRLLQDVAIERYSGRKGSRASGKPPGGWPSSPPKNCTTDSGNAMSRAGSATASGVRSLVTM